MGATEGVQTGPSEKKIRTATLPATFPLLMPTTERTATKTMTTIYESATAVQKSSENATATQENSTVNPIAHSGPSETQNPLSVSVPSVDQDMGADHDIAESSTTQRTRPAEEVFGPVVDARIKKEQDRRCCGESREEIYGG